MKKFKYSKKNFLGIGIFILVLIAVFLYTRNSGEGFQTEPDLTLYGIRGRNVWATDRAIREAFGSIQNSTSTLQIIGASGIVLDNATNTLTGDNTEIKLFQINETVFGESTILATTINLNDIDKPIPESVASYPITLKSYQLFTLTPGASPDIKYPLTAPVYPYEIIGLRLSSSDSLLKDGGGNPIPTGPPPANMNNIIKDVATSTIVYGPGVNLLTDSTTIKLYDFLSQPISPQPYYSSYLSLGYIDKPFFQGSTDTTTLLKNFIVKDNINNTTIYQPPLPAPTAPAPTTPTTTTTSAPTTTTPTTTTTTPTTTAAGVTPAGTVTPKAEDKLSTGAIVGIAIGATVVIGGGVYLAIALTSAPATTPLVR